MTPAELEELTDRIAESAAHIDAATHGLLSDIRVFDASKEWYGLGAKSAAHYLSWRIGLGAGAAREKVRVARALGDLPLIDDAMRVGRVSYSKVRAMTRVATPGNEEVLLNVALCSPAAQLEKTCRLLRQTQRASEDVPAGTDRRWVTSRGTGDGMVSIQIRVRPEEAAVIVKAMESCVPEGGSQADGAVALAEGRLRGNAVDKPAVEVMLAIDAASMTGETELGDGVSAETCRRILCDAGVVPVLTDERGNTLDVGRKTRQIPPALRRAVMRRDGMCRFPGCTTTHVDCHHVEHWLGGGETKLANLTALCRYHHTAIHDGLASVTMVDGHPVFRDKHGHVMHPAPARPEGSPLKLRRRNGRCGVAITPTTSLPNWDGTAPDYDYIIGVLVN